jgi:signal transduction histidine kinase
VGGLALARPSIVALAVACAFFLAAGVMRLARWRIVGEPHNALAGAALLVMGGLALPLGGVAALFPVGHELSLAGPASRTAAVLVAVVLLVRALTALDMSDVELPRRLLPSIFGAVIVVFLVLLLIERAAPDTVAGVARFVVVLAAVRSLLWFGVGLFAATRSADLVWAQRVAPLLVGMGLAEALRGMDLGRAGAWTFAALLVCLSMAALSARSALLDLEDAVSADEQGRSHLAEALTQVSEEAVELTEWREQLTHDARNACAGLRAALTILEQNDDRIDPATRERVRMAAVQELAQIEHLLTRSPEEPCAPFEVTEVVRRVAEAAWTVGARVSIHGLPVHAIGRPGDLASVLKNLLVNVETHAAGSQVRLRVISDRDTVTITCADDGPGLQAEVANHAFDRGYRSRTSPGSGLGLHGARELMREQGGDLTLAPSASGATFRLTLPRAAVPAGQALPVRVPTQRSLRQAPQTLGTLPVA